MHQILSVISHEACPQCGLPSAVCQHGCDALTGAQMHYWMCPACGDWSARVGYDCADCRTPTNATRAAIARARGEGGQDVI